MIVVRDILEDLFLSVKSIGNVSSISNIGNTQTIITSDIGNLDVGIRVKLIHSDSLQDKDVTITAITSNSFSFVNSVISNPISWEMCLYFESGHRKEINEKMIAYSNGINKLLQKYPLLWLYTDFERKPSKLEGAEFETDIRFGLLVDSNNTDYEETRIENNFKPLLYKYTELIEAAFNGIYKRNFITQYGQTEIELLEVDRPFFGSADKNESVLSYFTDAIEFQVNLAWRELNPVCSGF